MPVEVIDVRVADGVAKIIDRGGRPIERTVGDSTEGTQGRNTAGSTVEYRRGVNSAAHDSACDDAVVVDVRRADGLDVATVQWIQIYHSPGPEQETVHDLVPRQAGASNDVTVVIYRVRKGLGTTKRSKVGDVIRRKACGTEDATVEQRKRNDRRETNTEDLSHDASPHARVPPIAASSSFMKTVPKQFAWSVIRGSRGGTTLQLANQRLTCFTA